MSTYSSHPLFTLRACSQECEIAAGRSSLGRCVEDDCDSSSVSVSLPGLLQQLEAKRRGEPVVYHNDTHTHLADLDPSYQLYSNMDHNNSLNTLDTLISSVEMLTHEQAAALSLTNAPIMKALRIPKPPRSTKSV